MMKKIISTFLLAMIIFCGINLGANVAFAAENNGGGVEPLSSATEEKIAVEDISGVYVANTPVEIKNGDEVIGTLKISKDSSGPGFQAGSIFSFVPNEKYTVKKVIYLANNVTAKFTIGSGCSSVSGLTDEEVTQLEAAGVVGINKSLSCSIALNSEYAATESDPYQFTLNAEVDRGSICVIYEVKNYYTVTPNKNNYSNIKIGERYGDDIAKIWFTSESDKGNSSVTLNNSSRFYITPSPGYVIESVTLTNSASYNWELRQEGVDEKDLTFSGSNPTYTITGFKGGQSYDMYSRTDRYGYASITSITVTYREHVHETYSPNHDEDYHWEECICKARINEEAHSWTMLNETQPSAGLAGERNFKCDDCHAEKTEIIPCAITDENITVSLASQLRYTSASLTQKVVIKVGDTVLEEYTDYTLSGNEKKNPGNYTLTITGKGKYSGTRELDFSILKGQVTIPAEDTREFYYTGSNQTYNIPTNSRYNIVGSTTKSTVGRTDIVLSLKDTAHYEWADGTTDDITYVFEIAKATYDMSEVVFEDKTVTYNGSEFSLEATNLPTGVTVTYENNGKTAAGEYIVIAKFTGDTTNYNEIPNQTAVLTIEKATYNMSGVVFNGLTVIYDGNTYSLEATNLPSGVTVTYQNNGKTNAGTYTVVAKFTGDANYNDIPDMEATLTINKLTYDMSGIKFDDVTVTYNGSEHTVVITGTLPNGVTVSYTTNKGTNAGTYNAVASFTGDANYNDIPDMEATLTINKATYDMSGVVFADKTVTYNGSAYSLEATNLPDGVTVTYENNGKTDVGVYTVTAKFTGNANYNDIPDMESTLTINKATYDMSGVVFGDTTVTYNGSAQSILATNLPDGVTVTYENNGKTDVGVYTVTAKFTGNANYNDIPNMEATLIVNKATYDMSGVIFADKTVVYNGSAFTIEATNLPNGVTVSYENNGKTDVGVYTVTAKFTSNANYGDIPDMTATLTISKATYDMSGIKFDDVTVTYNGSEHTVVITGTLPDGVTVSYTTNKGTNAGTYNAVASFTGDANYNDIPDMEATLTINKATYDMSVVVFADKTVVYNGSTFSLEATNLPSGVTVVYENNGKTDAGVYTVTAKFTGNSNYNVIADKTATLTIKNASLIFNTNTENEIADDIVISAPDGIDPNKELVVELVETTKDYKEFIGKKQRVAIAYDIKLLMDGATVQPDGTLQFKVLIPEELRNRDFGIMHIHNSNETSVIEYQIDGDFVVFESDKLSDFVFVYDMGSMLWLIIVLAVIALLEVGFLVFLSNKQKIDNGTKLASVYPPFIFGMFLAKWQLALVIALAVVVVALTVVSIIFAIKVFSKKNNDSIEATEEAEITEETEDVQQIIEAEDDDAERKGNIDKSFLDRLSQCSPETIEYYNIIRNELLSYKNVKSKISFKHEFFRYDMPIVARLKIKHKALYLYLALNPDDYKDSKYMIKDMSAIGNNKDAPTMYKINVPERADYAKELIADLMKKLNTKKTDN